MKKRTWFLLLLGGALWGLSRQAKARALAASLNRRPGPAPLPLPETLYKVVSPTGVLLFVGPYKQCQGEAMAVAGSKVVPL